MTEKPETIRTDRLVLKALDGKDKDAMLRMAMDKRVTKTYMINDFADQAQADAFFERLKNLSAAKDRFVYGIYLGGGLIGFINDCAVEGPSIELGYFISSDQWNKGYATEALRAAIGALFRMGFETVTAGYFEENPASGRVMVKCGMRQSDREETIDYRGVSHRCLFREIGREDILNDTP